MRYLVWLLLAVVPFCVFAAEKKSEQGDLKSSMQELLVNMQALRPYMVSEEKFSDPANEGKIRDRLSQLAKQVKNLKHEQISSQPGLKISKKVLEDHLSETNLVFRIGNKSYARWALNSTFGICVSCHTQAPSASKGWSLIGFGDFGNEFDQAEFLFAARDFDRALQLYDKLIGEFPDNKLQASDLETAVERKVAIFARVKRDFKAGLNSIMASQKNKKIPEHIRRNLLAWEGLFRAQTKNSFPDVKTANDEDIRKYVAREMKRGLWDSLIEANNPRLVTNLTVSGVLYEYLNLHPDTAIKGEILYWLALCDRSLNNNFFYSLADLYLKECVTSFPTQPIAKSCYKEYEINTILSYSGSSGVHVPDDVREELLRLRRLVHGSDE
jgi:tetratricopeptide (TPR) repeat protein